MPRAPDGLFHPWLGCWFLGPHVLGVNAFGGIRLRGPFDNGPAIGKQRQFVGLPIVLDLGLEHEPIGLHGTMGGQSRGDLIKVEGLTRTQLLR